MDFYKEINGHEVIILFDGYELADFQGAYYYENDAEGEEQEYEMDYEDIPEEIVGEIERELEERRQENEDEYDDNEWQEQQSLERWIVGANY